MRQGNRGELVARNDLELAVSRPEARIVEHERRQRLRHLPVMSDKVDTVQQREAIRRQLIHRELLVEVGEFVSADQEVLPRMGPHLNSPAPPSGTDLKTRAVLGEGVGTFRGRVRRVTTVVDKGDRSQKFLRRRIAVVYVPNLFQIELIPPTSLYSFIALVFVDYSVAKRVGRLSKLPRKNPTGA